jgi:hypothetical protein
MARRKGASGRSRRRRRAGPDHGGGDKGDLVSTYGETEIELICGTLLWSGGEPGSVERRRRGDGDYVREPPSGLRELAECSGVEREKRTWSAALCQDNGNFLSPAGSYTRHLPGWIKAVKRGQTFNS